MAKIQTIKIEVSVFIGWRNQYAGGVNARQVSNHPMSVLRGRFPGSSQQADDSPEAAD